MTRQSTIDNALAHFDSGEFYEALGRRVAIPTESQNPDRVPELYQYLEEEMRPAFEEMGYDCKIYDNPLEAKAHMDAVESL